MSKKLKHRIIFAIGCILLFVLCVGAVNAVLSLFVKDDKVAETNQKTKQVKKEIPIRLLKKIISFILIHI